MTIEVDFLNKLAGESRLTVKPSEISEGVLLGRDMLLASCNKNDDGGTVFILDSNAIPLSIQDLEKKSRAMMLIKKDSSAQIGIAGEIIAEIRHISK